MSPSRTQCRKPSGDQAQQLVAGRMAQGVVDLLEVVEIEAEHGEFGAAAARSATAASMCSWNSMRFGRPVSASWRAMKTICCSFRRFSVTSSKVTTVPPLAIGWLAIWTSRPERTSISICIGRREVNHP